MTTAARILMLQHDADDPPERLGDWLIDAGAELDVRRCDVGDPIPADLSGHDALISLGGSMNAYADAAAPWLPAVRALLATATRAHQPVLGICLGAQLLAAATGGGVITRPDGPEIGARLIAKRDAAENDPLFADMPMTPDVMQYHYDVVDVLPPGAVLLYSGPGDPHQAFRVGERSWGLQFHIETSAATLRAWAESDQTPLTPRTIRALGPDLDHAEIEMAVVWRFLAQRFVGVIAADPNAVRPGQRLPLLPGGDR